MSSDNGDNGLANGPPGGEGTAYQDTCFAMVDQNITCVPWGFDLTGIDPARIILPFAGVNETGCEVDMVSSDMDLNGQLSRQEYYKFITDTAARRCIKWPKITLAQAGIFNSLACQCISKTGDDKCCTGSRAHLSTAGAADVSSRTEEQDTFLKNVCHNTYGTLPTTNCSIQILPINNPPPPQVVPPVDPRTGATATGTHWNLLGPAIATFLLLLLCCCCCCGAKRRKVKEYEEEEIIEQEIPGKEEWLEQPLPEQAPRELLAVPAALGAAAANPFERVPADDESWESEQGSRGGVYSDQESDDGDGRKRRGGHLAPDEEADTKRKWPSGFIDPPVKPQEKIVLKPIPPKEPVPPPEWDEPQREIDEVKVRDDMSAQEFDPYNPDGGVYDPRREGRDPVTWTNEWERGTRPEEDEYDRRKHRIQGGLGSGEVWDRLDESQSRGSSKGGGANDVFDWVVKSALHVMDSADQQGHLECDDDSTVPPSGEN